MRPGPELLDLEIAEDGDCDLDGADADLAPSARPGAQHGAPPSLGDSKEMQDACVMVVDFIHKFGGKWVQQLRSGIRAAGPAGPGVYTHMDWITPQLLVRRLLCIVCVCPHTQASALRGVITI